MLLRGAADISHENAVEAGPSHDGEALAVDAADIEAPSHTVQRNAYRLTDVEGDIEIGGEKVCGASRDDCERNIGTRHDIDALLHHAIAAPHHDQLRPVGYGLAYPLGCVPALGNFGPHWFGHAVIAERLPQLFQATSKSFSYVCDDSNFHCVSSLD